MIPKRPGAWVLSSFVFLDTTPFVSIKWKGQRGVPSIYFIRVPRT